MGLRLNVIFITNVASLTNEELLTKLGLEDKEKWSRTSFYGTSKKENSLYVGTKGQCKIISNGALAHSLFKNENPFLNLKNSEVASIIWNETASIYGFCLIKNGEMIRQILSFDVELIEGDFGAPIPKEIEIKSEDLFDTDTENEIIEAEGLEYFNNLVKAEKACKAANNLAKRYVGCSLVEIGDDVEMIEYC